MSGATQVRASAIAVAFVANGLGGPSFLPRLPGRQADLGLSDAGLGVVLVGMAAGALVASPIAGRAVGRAGSRPVVVGSAVLLGATMWTAGAAPDPVLLFLALAVIGAADAAMDIAMNANGGAYERAAGRSVMHRLHGAWSLGALAAAGLAAAAAAANVPLTWQLVAAGAVVAASVVAAQGGLVRGDAQVRDRPPPSPTPAAATGHGDLVADGASPPPRGRTAGRSWALGPIALLATMTVAGAIIEGAAADWSAIQLDRLGAGPGTAALGLAAFMTGMLVSRLAGDRLTDRFGGRTVLRSGMLLVAAGLGAGALSGLAVVFALGLVVAGLGAGGLFPLAFSAAANTPGLAPGTGAATVSLAARLGFLAEPLLIGVLAELLSLRAAFLIVAAVALAVAAQAHRVVPPSSLAT